jgi:hypothetical protein
MTKTRRCRGCERPTTDFIVVAGQRLPYHPECALEAERDLRAIRDGITDALAARIVQRCTCDGALPRADEI